MDRPVALVEEQLDVATETIETGRVRIDTRVVETEQVVDVALQRDDVEIERVSVNRVVEQAAPTRHEGDVTIVPVYEEVLVVTKQLVLKEELRIRRRSSVQPAQPQSFKLRREEVAITRSPAAPSD